MPVFSSGKDVLPFLYIYSLKVSVTFSAKTRFEFGGYARASRLMVAASAMCLPFVVFSR